MGKKRKKVFEQAAELREAIDEGVRCGELSEEEAQIMRNELVAMYNIVYTQMHNRQKCRF